MADYLAIDFDNQQLCGFEASVTKGALRLRRAFTLALPSEEQLRNETDDESDLSATERRRRLGEWLRQEWTQRKITARQVLVSLPRDRAVVRSLEVPDVPDRELPDIVRLQAETKISSALDSLRIDFLPLAKREGAETRDVLLATVGRETAEDITALLEAADCEVATLGLSSVAVAETVRQVEEKRNLPAGLSLVVAPCGGRLEISLLRQAELVFTHAAQIHGESPAETRRLLLGEVSRSLMAMQELLAGHNVQRCWVIGPAGKVAPLCDALRERLSCEVFPLEPLRELGLSVEEPAEAPLHSACFAGPLGLLLAQAARSANQLDFLHPRQSTRRIDRRTLRTGLIAAAALLVVLAGGFSVWGYQRSLETTRQELNRKLQNLKSTTFRGRPTLESAEAIRQWMRGRSNLLDEMERLKETFPGTDRIYFTEFRLRGLPGTKKERLRIEAVGFAVERRDVELLKQQLADRQYLVKPKPEKLSSRDPKYKYRFELEVEVTDQTDKAPLPGGAP